MDQIYLGLIVLFALLCLGFIRLAQNLKEGEE